MDLLSQATNLVLNLLITSVVALLVLTGQEVILLTLFISDPVVPLLFQSGLDFFRAEVLHLLLDRVEMLVLEDLVGCLWFLRQVAVAEFKLEFYDLSLLVRSEIFQGEWLGTVVLVA